MIEKQKNKFNDENNNRLFCFRKHSKFLNNLNQKNLAGYFINFWNFLKNKKIFKIRELNLMKMFKKEISFQNPKDLKQEI